jgi:hypothetical protein
MVYVYWNGIEWKKVFGFEDEQIMRDRIQSLEDRIKNGEIDVLTHLPQSNNKNIANTEYVDKAISYFMHPVGSEYAQLDITGEGFEKRSPAMLFNFIGENGTDSGTTWELLFMEGVYFKTEGGDNEDENPLRVNGIQPDGIRDFSWIQTKTAPDHTHTLKAEKENQIGVKGNADASSFNHYHTLSSAINATAETESHSHEGSVIIEPSELVANAPSISSTGVGPVIAPVPAQDGYYSYGTWSGIKTGVPPNNAGMDYEVITSPTEGIPGEGEWVYGTWSDPISGSPPYQAGWEYEILSSGTDGHLGDWSEWEHINTVYNTSPTEEYRAYYTEDWHNWGNPTNPGDQIGTVYNVPPNIDTETYKEEYSITHKGLTDWIYGWIEDNSWRHQYWGPWNPDGKTNLNENEKNELISKNIFVREYDDNTTIPGSILVHYIYNNYANNEKTITYDIYFFPHTGQWTVHSIRRKIVYKVERRTQTWVDGVGGIYKRRTKTWVDGGTPADPGSYRERTKTWHPPVQATDGSGSVDAVSSVNTSFASFSVNTSGISLGGDGSHSHTVNIPTTATSNDAAHTHSVTANGTADINVSGSTISGGAHSHTFDFNYNELKDISNQNTRIASETTVKNRKMRIWRRTA